MSTTLLKPSKTKCQHKHTVIETIGYIRFYAGDIIDTTRDILVCRDCGRKIRKGCRQ